MVDKGPIVDLSTVDLTQVFATRRNSPLQSAAVRNGTADGDRPRGYQEHICVGYKDVADTEFWVRGHMPDMPLMPGVIMCEAAAQLCSFYTQRFDLLGAEVVGFGGLEEVRFRDMVVPGDRFFVACQLLKVRRNRMIVAAFEGYVNGRIAVEGKIKGIPLPISSLREQMQHREAPPRSPKA